MAHILRLALILVVGLLFASCTTTTKPTAPKTGSTTAAPSRLARVKTTAYTHTERGGARNAIGRRLSSGGITSASADWSRYPLGTRFRLVSTGQEYVIDDYGGALVGTNTIDLYKSCLLYTSPSPRD